MLFLIYQRSYVGGRVIEATPLSPKVERFADNPDLDHISSQWHPLDDAAKAALKRLAAQSEARRANPDDGAGSRGAALRTALVAIQKQQHAAEEQRLMQDSQAEIAKAIAEGTMVAAEEAAADDVEPTAPAAAPGAPVIPRPPKPAGGRARGEAPTAPAAAPRPSDTSPIGG